MADGPIPKERGEAGDRAGVLEAKRGERFFLFPADQPIRHLDFAAGGFSDTPTNNLYCPGIHVSGIDGTFWPNLLGVFSLYTESGELSEHIDSGKKYVVATNGGPLVLAKGEGATNMDEILRGARFTELISWDLPPSVKAKTGVVITLFFPGFTPKYTPGAFFRSSGGTNFYMNAVDEDGSEINSIILPTDPDFLHLIEAEIS